MSKYKFIFLIIVIFILGSLSIFIIRNNSKETVAKETIETYLTALSNKNLDNLNSSLTSNSSLKYTTDDITLLTKILKNCELKNSTIVSSTPDTMTVSAEILFNCYDTPDAEIGDWSAGSNLSTRLFTLKKVDNTWKVSSFES
ncbi:MAG: hypothetical protein ACRDAU_08080 [Clostridium sp.]